LGGGKWIWRQMDGEVTVECSGAARGEDVLRWWGGRGLSPMIGRDTV